jgi:hypothetical protein
MKTSWASRYWPFEGSKQPELRGMMSQGEFVDCQGIVQLQQWIIKLTIHT